MTGRPMSLLPLLAALALLLAACVPPPSANPTGDFAPVVDTTIPGGTVTVDSMTIPAGVTVTVQQGSVFEVGGNVTVAGTLVVDCEGLELNVTGDLSVDGSIENACSNGATPGDLLLVVDGGLTLGAPGSSDPVLTSGGNIDIADSASRDEPLDPLALVTDLRERGDAGAIRPTQGAWSIDNAPAPGRSGRVRVTRDGDINVNVDLAGGDGADGADQNLAGMCDASGNKGSTGGTVSLAARNGTLTLAAGVTVTAGDGGRGGSVLVGGSNVVFGAGVTLVRGSGGPGGAATAIADDGVDCLVAGCDASATGGKGGPAGGIGYVILAPGSIVGNPSEDGGDGGRGGDAEAIAGDGGNCDDCLVGDGGPGGAAAATAGQGGNGATGNIWPVAANSHKKGDGGDASAFGGSGGDGADCCKFGDGGNGGDGGDASATAGAQGSQGINAGVDGTTGGSGGNGGDGGDGATPGPAGSAGSGTGSPGDISDGVDGLPGAVCEIVVWWVYYSSIADGFIDPGTGFLLDTYDNPNLVTGSVTGQVTSTFLDPAALTALGYPTQSGQMYPTYEKQGNQVRIGADPTFGFAGFDIDLSGLSGFPVDGLELGLSPIPNSTGTVILLGHGADGEVIQTAEQPVGLTEFILATLPPPPPTSGESVYSRITVISDFYFSFDHWGVVIVDP